MSEKKILSDLWFIGIPYKYDHQFRFEKVGEKWCLRTRTRPKSGIRKRSKMFNFFFRFFLSGKKNSSPKVASCSVGEKWCVALFSSDSFLIFWPIWSLNSRHLSLLISVFESPMKISCIPTALQEINLKSTDKTLVP